MYPNLSSAEFETTAIEIRFAKLVQAQSRIDRARTHITQRILFSSQNPFASSEETNQVWSYRLPLSI